MKREFAELPGGASPVARPVLDVTVAGMIEAPLRCLVDSSSVNTLMPAWVASAAGVGLDDAEVRRFAVGGATVDARFAVVRLAVGGHSWEAPVGFCDPWPYGWGLLGQAGFFRFFTVTFRAADWELEVEPNPA